MIVVHQKSVHLANSWALGISQQNGSEVYYLPLLFCPTFRLPKARSPKRAVHNAQCRVRATTGALVLGRTA